MISVRKGDNACGSRGSRGSKRGLLEEALTSHGRGESRR